MYANQLLKAPILSFKTCDYGERFLYRYESRQPVL